MVDLRSNGIDSRLCSFHLELPTPNLKKWAAPLVSFYHSLFSPSEWVEPSKKGKRKFVYEQNNVYPIQEVCQVFALFLNHVITALNQEKELEWAVKEMCDLKITLNERARDFLQQHQSDDTFKKKEIKEFGTLIKKDLIVILQKIEMKKIENLERHEHSHALFLVKRKFNRIPFPFSSIFSWVKIEQLLQILPLNKDQEHELSQLGIQIIQENDHDRKDVAHLLSFFSSNQHAKADLANFIALAEKEHISFSLKNV